MKNSTPWAALLTTITIGMGLMLIGCRPAIESDRPSQVPTKTTTEARNSTPEPDSHPAEDKAADSDERVLTVIDHVSLRRFSADPQRYEADIRNMRAGMDLARQFGADRYLLFARDFERLLLYDYPELAGDLGQLTPLIFPDDHPWRAEANLFRDLLRWASDEAQARDLELWFHSNQISLPDEVWASVGHVIGEEDSICPGRPQTWDLYSAMLSEFFSAVPLVAGLQITADETEYSVLECVEDKQNLQQQGSGNKSQKERVDELSNRSAKIARGFEREIEMRTWGRIYALAEENDPQTMFEGLEPSISLSLKNTSGDFLIDAPPSPLIGIEGSRQTIEFDAWREHNGWNLYPSYMGDQWADRVMHARAAGVRQFAVRINWNSYHNRLIDKPFGNIANLAVISALIHAETGQNQDAGKGADQMNAVEIADEALRDYIKDALPSAQPDAAFNLYKRSPDIQRVLTMVQGQAATDHSRVFQVHDEADSFDRVEGRLRYIQKSGALGDWPAFEARYTDIAEADEIAQAMIGQLGDGLAPELRDDLTQGLYRQVQVALSTTDQMALLFLSRAISDMEDEGRDNLASDASSNARTKLDETRDRLILEARARNEAWAKADPEGHALLEGQALMDLLTAEF